MNFDSENIIPGDNPGRSTTALASRLNNANALGSTNMGARKLSANRPLQKQAHHHSRHANAKVLGLKLSNTLTSPSSAGAKSLLSGGKPKRRALGDITNRRGDSKNKSSPFDLDDDDSRQTQKQQGKGGGKGLLGKTKITMTMQPRQKSVQPSTKNVLKPKLTFPTTTNTTTITPDMDALHVSPPPVTSSRAKLNISDYEDRIPRDENGDVMSPEIIPVASTTSLFHYDPPVLFDEDDEDDDDENDFNNSSNNRNKSSSNTSFINDDGEVVPFDTSLFTSHARTRRTQRKERVERPPPSMLEVFNEFADDDDTDGANDDDDEIDSHALIMGFDSPGSPEL